MSERRLEYLDLAELRPNPANPKAHDLPELRASMGRFGYTEPIMVDERTGLLVAGHGRRELLLDDLAAGRDPPEGVEVGGDGTWRVPVVRGWASDDDDEALAYLIASNRIPEKGGWDADPLAAALAILEATEQGMVGVGYDGDDLRRLLGQVVPSAPDPETTNGAERRNVQGLHEVGLIFQTVQFHEYQELMAKLRHRWTLDASPLVVLRAMREANEAVTHA